ncbi:DUF5615 family PIN-like protein [Hymenobacter glacialis]|uniref:DUF5615 domain-containing protein n=1 Tax=Hymenobacter glacialis TaxID=1908236 RepID=A0A1G1T3Z7_9BACT|nr:DUF5615 family PIN-like protein [Hymenobacter glacialis]OGX85592.1 hypothetical protein BEN48_01800 [Hymenobacter glacialis]
MTIWIDAHLSPLIAAWIKWKFPVEAVPLRTLGLRDAEDEEIFRAAKAADFRPLLDRFGPLPQVIWLTCGNTSNTIRTLLKTSFSCTKEIALKNG